MTSTTTPSPKLQGLVLEPLVSAVDSSSSQGALHHLTTMASAVAGVGLTNENLVVTVAASSTGGGADGATGPFQMAYPADIAWTLVFSFMIVSAFVGNLVVFWIVLGHRRMQNVTNYFLVNLSLADLMMCCLNTIFNFIFMKNRNWIFGSVYCTINNFIAYLSVAVSVFTLMAISIDRYIAIVRPLKPRMSKTCARIFLVVIWVSSSLLSLPSLLYSTTWTMEYKEGDNLTVCFILWPDGPPNVSKQDYIYNIVYFILTYIVPIVAMGICYGRIGSVLWGKGTIRENACNHLAQERKLMSKRKVVKMFIVVVIIFAVCWLPYHVYFIYTYHHKEIVSKPFIQHVYLGFYWLAMANSMFNPFIYYWMNARFRGYFLALLSSLRLVICEPTRLFRRSDSKSSLNIGVVPVNRGVVNMELAHYTSNMHSKKDVVSGARLSHSHLHDKAVGPGGGGGGGGGGAGGGGFSGPGGVSAMDVRPLPAAPAPSLDSSAWAGTSCCRANGNGLALVALKQHLGREVSSNSAPEPHYCDTAAAAAAVHKATKTTAKSTDALLRIAVPFRNNPVLKYKR